MITSPDNRTFNLDRIGARERGKSHDDWVNSSNLWNNDPREISRAQQILLMAEEIKRSNEKNARSSRK